MPIVPTDSNNNPPKNQIEIIIDVHPGIVWPVK